MKCPNCGAEIKNNARECEYCGSVVSTEMRKEQDQQNKQGCPKCGSANVAFSREKEGEVSSNGRTVVVRSTVGVCKDCGYTWHPNEQANRQCGNQGGTVRKRKTLLWVLGWIFIFPVPLTILLLRKKEMKPVVKYTLIAVSWILYFIIGLSGNSNDSAKPSNDMPSTTISQESTESAENTSTVATSTSGSVDNEAHIYDSSEIKDVMNGTRTEKIGEYSVIYAASSECTEDTVADWYYNFVAVHNYNYNIIVFTDKDEPEGCYAIHSMVEIGVMFDKDEYGDYSVGASKDAVIYAPSDDGKTLIKLEFSEG